MTDPIELLQRLIQFNTTNPPGDEAECIAYIRDLLGSAGIDSQTYEKVVGRPNLVARLKGAGQAPPLLLYGHVDVVTTAKQDWAHPPFEAVIVDDYVWGRGALDMKGGVAMMVAAFLRASAGEEPPPGDVILCIVSDEEAGGEMGAAYMVDEHPDLFADVRYAIGEFGGFSLMIGGKRFYPIMVAEKQVCWMRALVRGPAGHGSMPIRGGAVAKLGKILAALDTKRLPVHVTPAARIMVESIAAELGGVTGLILRQMLNPALTNRVLNLLGERGRIFDPLLHNTVSPTILQASDKINVIPAEVVLELDGRLLPGYTPDDMMRELRGLLGPDVALSLVRHDPYPAEPDMGLFDLLADTLRKADPAGVPVPLVMPGVTDGRFFAKLGIQTYGYLPMTLPEDFNFIATIHAADERIPVAALEFGTQAIYSVLQQFHQADTQ